MKTLPWFLLAAALAGCGVETAGTAAVAAKAAEEEARRGQQLQAEMAGRLDAAQQGGQQRLDEAAKATQ